MFRNPLQLKKAAAAACGYFVFPCIAALPLLYMDPLKYNYTGILNLPGARPAAAAGALAYGMYLTWLLEKLHPCRRNLLFAALWAAGVLIPYAPGSAAGQLHLLAGTAGFAVLQTALFPLWYRSRACTQFYMAACMLAGLLIMTFSSVTGWAEIAYATPLPALLTYLWLHA